MFKVRVEEIKWDRLYLHVESMHKPVQNIPVYPNFLLQILVEVYWKMSVGKVEQWDYSPEYAARRMEYHPCRYYYEQWVDCWMGQEVQLTKESYESVKTSIQESDCYQGRRVSAIIRDEDEYTLHLLPDYNAFIQHTYNAIADIIPWHYKNTKGMIIADLAEPGMLFHLEEEMEFMTNAFDYRTVRTL